MTTDAHDGEFTWTPTGDLRDGSNYAFKITQGDAVNYSPIVQITGGDNTQRDTQTTEETTSATPATSSAPSTTSMAATTSSAPSTPSTPSSPSMRSTPSSLTQPTHPTPTPASSSAARTKASSSSTSSQSATSSQFTPLKPTSTMELPKHVPTGAAARSAAPLVLGLGAAAALLFLQ